MKNRIKEILEKYYSGKSSLEEEQLLKDFFSKNENDEDLKPDKELFALHSNTKFELPADFEDDLWSTISRKDSNSNPKNNILSLITSWSAAAILVLGIGLGLYIFNNREKHFYADTYSDPQIALEETQRVLALFASNLSLAQDELEPLSRLNVANKAVEPFAEIAKQIEHIEKIKTLDKPMSIPLVKELLKQP